MLEEKILAYLGARPGKTVSGAQMAEAFGVSRNAVWKGVKRLQEKGVDIASRERAGYILEEVRDILIPDRVKAYLPKDHPFQFHYESAPASTNDIAKQLAEEGAPAGTVVLADSQSAGKGRMGRSFFSPAGTGIYFSLIFRPQEDPALSGLLTVAAAVAVAEAAERASGQAIGIKWVNDCFVGKRKFSGILTEAALSMEDLSLRYAVVGVGVNVTEPEEGFPMEIADSAGALFPAGSPMADRRAKLTANILQGLWRYGQDLAARPFLKEYEKRLNMLHVPLTVYQGKEIFRAKALGIDEKARLIVEDEGGQKHILSGGEIRL